MHSSQLAEKFEYFFGLSRKRKAKPIRLIDVCIYGFIRLLYTFPSHAGRADWLTGWLMAYLVSTPLISILRLFLRAHKYIHICARSAQTRLGDICIANPEKTKAKAPQQRAGARTAEKEQKPDRSSDRAATQRRDDAPSGATPTPISIPCLIIMNFYFI